MKQGPGHMLAAKDRASQKGKAQGSGSSLRRKRNVTCRRIPSLLFGPISPCVQPPPLPGTPLLRSVIFMVPYYLLCVSLCSARVQPPPRGDRTFLSLRLGISGRPGGHFKSRLISAKSRV